MWWQGFEPNPGFEDKKKEQTAAAPSDEMPPLAACLNANDFEAVARKFMPLTGAAASSHANESKCSA